MAVRRELKSCQRQYHNLLHTKAKQESKLRKVFLPDQIEALSCQMMRGVLWSNVTVKKALQLWFACSKSGYQTLLQQYIPLPSERTLQWRLENVSFCPGVLQSVFDFLKLKVKKMAPEEKICCMTLDKMPLTSKLEYDVWCWYWITCGWSDLGQAQWHSKSCNGIYAWWHDYSVEQSLAYHFTVSSTDGSVLKDLVLEILGKANEIGLHVIAITCDMGSVNCALWKIFGAVIGGKAIVNKFHILVKITSFCIS